MSGPSSLLGDVARSCPARRTPTYWQCGYEMTDERVLELCFSSSQPIIFRCHHSLISFLLYPFIFSSVTFFYFYYGINKKSQKQCKKARNKSDVNRKCSWNLWLPLAMETCPTGKRRHHGKCWLSVVQTRSQLERLEEKVEWLKTWERSLKMEPTVHGGAPCLPTDWQTGIAGVRRAWWEDKSDWELNIVKGSQTLRDVHSVPPRICFGSKSQETDF